VPGMGGLSAPDGHGGIWLAMDVGTGQASTAWFCHYSGGRWTRTAVPKTGGQQPLMVNLSWILGTRSLWATGEVDTADGGEAILKYGP
jgi:hypothetical protein